MFSYTLKNNLSRIPTPKSLPTCRLCEYRRENGKRSNYTDTIEWSLLNRGDESKFFFFTLPYSENYLNASLLIVS